jgi:type VII secretion integral membrane protein EccD
MTDYTRVTVVTDRRNVELLLPSQAPVDGLIPEVIGLLQLPASEHPSRAVLTPVGGPTLDGAASLEDARIPDGAVLSLERAEDAVPSPLIYDVTDHVASRFGHVPGSWDARGRALVTGICLVVLGVAGYAWLTSSVAGTPALLIAAGTALVLMGVAAAASPQAVPVAWAVLVAATGILACGALRALGPTASGMLWTLGAAVAASLGWQAHRRSWRALLIDLVSVVLLAGAWSLAWWLCPTPTTAASVAGTVSVIVLGALPRFALGLSGLNGLDDARHQGKSVLRPQVERALAEAHRGLVWTVLWCSVSMTVATTILTVDGGAPQWCLPLAVCWCVVAALRVRALPLVAQRAFVALASAVGALIVAARVAHYGVGAAAGVGGGLIVASLLVILPAVLPLAPHMVARFRLLGDRVESVAVLAMIPLVIGAFGVYAALLQTFGGGAS